MRSMNICAHGSNFAITWTMLTILGVLSVSVSSGIVFKMYFVDVTYERWKKKIHPNYPSPEKVREEILLMLKGLVFSTICPTLAIWLGSRGWSKAYCTFTEDNQYGLGHHLFQFVTIVVCSDLYEWFYHRLGHVFPSFWKFHKHHHAFYNPSPFSVISDEYVDQFVRSAPIVLFPLVMPTNMELLFVTYALFFYVYGVYLHWGHETEWLHAHHPIINTSYQHYIHHAKAVLHKPYHTGFFVKVWDQLAGSVLPPGECTCLHCQPPRTMEEYKSIPKPDYSVLWKDYSFLWHGKRPAY